MINKIYNEDCLDTMARMEDNFIDLTVTSPPYDNLRTYKNKVDETWGENIWKPIIKELYRVTKDGGVVIWVIGDATIKGSETGSSFKQALFFLDIGFRLHDTMIYMKRGFAFPGRVRYHNVFEYMFVFSKRKPKTISLIKDRKNKWTKPWGKQTRRQRNGVLQYKKTPKEFDEFGYRFNIWEYNVGKGFSTKDKIAYEHPAIFPDKLAEDHIISWSKEGDLIYDPFIGSGTTAKMAIKNNRNFIGSETIKEYCDIAEERIRNEKR